MGTIQIDGSTPKITVGNATAEDATILFDGNAQDFHIGLDDSSDSLVLGLGSSLGTTPAITINSSQVATFAQAPVFPDGSIAVADLDIDGATDVGAAIVDADLFIMDDGAGGTNRKVAASRIKTYAGGSITALNNATANELVTIGSTTTELDAEANLTFSGSALQCTATLTVGVDDTGHDVKFFGATASSHMLWDESADDLNLIASGLGVTTAKDLGAGIHIRTADSGASVAAGADELVIENSGAAGISILSGTSSNGSIYFADSGGTSRGWVEYEHANGKLTMGTENATALTIDSIGAVNKPLQPAFLEFITTNETLSGLDSFTAVKYGTEVFDQNADFNTSNYTFTAPVTGRYQLNATCGISGQDDSTELILRLDASNRDLDIREFSTASGGNVHMLTGSVLMDMDASDTCKIEIKVASASAEFYPERSNFSGYLVA